jgi:hypothetical protein
MHIRIVSTPPGEAPEEVRAAWIGLVVPAAVPGVRPFSTSGVLSGPKSRLGRLFSSLFGRFEVQNGYLVEACQAVELLSRHAPEAAKWWREATPHLITPGKYLVFSAESCQEVES